MPLRGAPCIVVLLLVAACGSSTATAPHGGATHATPPPPPAGPSHLVAPRFLELTTSRTGACARDDAGRTLCWGEQLGLTPQVKSTTATALLGTMINIGAEQHMLQAAACRVEGGHAVDCGPVSGMAVRRVFDLGWLNGCAWMTDGTVGCWGSSDGGFPIFGVGALHPVTGITGASSVTVGGRLGCAVVAGGQVKCWRRSYSGTPEVVDVALPAPATSVSAGDEHACARLTNGRVACWGGPSYLGELGTTESANTDTPLLVDGIAGATDVSSGAHTTCALVDGHALCWGLSPVLDATACAVRGREPHPRPIAGLEHVRKLELNDRFGCAIDDAGRVLCFGHGEHGELGDGMTYLGWPSSAARPIRVDAPPTANCMPTGDRDLRDYNGQCLIDDTSARFCIQADCFAVDLATGHLVTPGTPWPAPPTPAPIDDGVRDVSAGPHGRLHACDADDHCVDLPVSRTIAGAHVHGVTDTHDAGTLIAWGYDDTEYDQGVVFEGYDRATLRKIFDGRLPTDNREHLALIALGASVVAHAGQSFLLDPHTGAKIGQALRVDADGPLALPGGRYALASDGHYVVLDPSGPPRVVEIADHVMCSAISGDRFIVVSGPPTAGNVQVLDASTGAVRASYTPPPCETDRPARDACASPY